VRGVLDAFAVILTWFLDRFSKEVEAEYAQEREIVAQEAEGKLRNAWSSLYSCKEVKIASLW
jgi:hypothetical protein